MINYKIKNINELIQDTKKHTINSFSNRKKFKCMFFNTLL